MLPDKVQRYINRSIDKEKKMKSSVLNELKKKLNIHHDGYAVICL